MKLAIRDDASRALPLMEEVMRGGEPLAPDYPLIFEDGHPGRVAVAEDEGEIVSGCAILERELVYPGGRCRAGLIGSVSTSSSHRGRGLATAVLQCAEDELRDRGCLFALLWAEDPGFYEPRGYRHVGAETDFVLPAELVHRLPDSRGVRAAGTADFGAMHALYADHAVRAERSEAESAALYGTPGMSTLVDERAGRVAAYACLGRGHDLSGVVHEWGGSAEGVLACIRSLLGDRPPGGREQPLFLMAPGPAGELGSRLDELGIPAVPGVLGMGKLLDERAAAELLLGASETPLRPVPGEVDLSRSDLLDALFAPRGDRAPVERLERSMGTRFPGLPWTPFLWGLDSI